MSDTESTTIESHLHCVGLRPANVCDIQAVINFEHHTSVQILIRVIEVSAFLEIKLADLCEACGLHWCNHFGLALVMFLFQALVVSHLVCLEYMCVLPKCLRTSPGS